MAMLPIIVIFKKAELPLRLRFVHVESNKK
jgi:hypothetical protein